MSLAGCTRVVPSVFVVPVSLQTRRRTKGGVVDDSWQCSRGSESVRDSVFPSSLLVTTLVQISCQVGVEVCECF